MSEYNFRVQLTCDAEPRTGLGGESINSLVPRDARGDPHLPGSHIKGLMRAALREIAIQRDEWRSAFEENGTSGKKQPWPYPLLDAVFGHEDSEDKAYIPKVRVENATIVDPSNGRQTSHADTHFVSRTALDESGLAKETSLRTNEAIAAGTAFVGSVFSEVERNSVEGIAWRLGLLAISAVGGSRSRNGQCLVDLLSADGSSESLAVDQLLLELDEAVRSGAFHEDRSIDSPLLSRDAELSQATAVIELIFAAATPVCFPERPDRANVITSGFCVPASAVQGAVLHLINRHDGQLADRLFHAENFRFWPLNPCSNETAETLSPSIDQHPLELFDSLPRSIRVSLSHRAAKFTLGDTQSSHFFEPAFGPRQDAYRWPETPDGVPLKASDGVLLFDAATGNSRRLWRSTMMPRSLTTHGVVDGSPENSDSGVSRRNLFSVEAMMPMCWRGMMVVPENVANEITERINECREIRLGKGRSVRGRGRLIALHADSASHCFGGPQHNGGATDRTAMVLQSPLAIPDALCGELSEGRISADEVLRTVATAWLRHHQLPELSEDPSTWANAGLRFGWNRHSSGGAFQAATPVLLPGSVFTLRETADTENLARAIMSGIHPEPGKPDDGKKRGFGCVAVHPGKAQGFFIPPPKLRRLDSGQLAQAMKLVYELRSVSHMPRPSQIRAVEQKIVLRNPQISKDSMFTARSYLQQQCERLPEVWHVWEPVIDHVETLLTRYPAEVAKQALKSLAEISIVHHETRGNR